MREKGIVLKKSIKTQLLAFAIQDSTLGELRIIYDGTEIRNIYFITIEVINESGKDCDPFTFRVALPPFCTILRNNCNLSTQDITKPILWVKDFANYFSAVIAEVGAHPQGVPFPEDLSNRVTTVTTNRRYEVPVFNDKSKIQLELIAGSINIIPDLENQIKCVILEKNVRLVYKTEEEAKKKKFKKWNLIIYSFVLVLSTIPIYFYSDSILTAMVLMASSIFVSSLISFTILTSFLYLKREFFERG